MVGNYSNMNNPLFTDNSLSKQDMNHRTVTNVQFITDFSLQSLSSPDISTKTHQFCISWPEADVRYFLMKD